MNRNLAYILDCAVDQVDQQQALGVAIDLVEQRQSAQIITLNVEMIYQAQSAPELRKLLEKAELVVPDGIGTVWAGRRQGYSFPERVTGIDLMSRLCAEAARRGWRVYLLGSAPGVADKAGQRLQALYPGLQVAGCHDGYFTAAEEVSVVQEIKELAPDLLFVALGIPKQELFIDLHRQEMRVPLCMGVGGSLDVLSGAKKRAPGWIISLHLEWLYRLLQEPSRVKRQTVLPRFVLMVIRRGRSK